MRKSQRVTGHGSRVTKKRRRKMLVMLPALFLFGMSIQQVRLLSYARYQARTHLPSLTLSKLGSHLLIFAAHPDDETLGCGGLIFLAQKAGIKVKVVIVSAGEGFSLAICRQFRKVRIRPQDRLRFARLRESEAIQSGRRLGLDSKDVIFLGFPETGLAPMWLSHWDASHTYPSSFVFRDWESLTPESRITNHESRYHGDEVLNTIQKVVRDFQPTAIFLPHRNDDHIAHWAVNAFIKAALLELFPKHPNTKTPKLFEYLIHYGDFPFPQGHKPAFELLPPKELLKASPGWAVLPLPKQAIKSKRNAIAAYKSQLALTRRFMQSFLRRNELFEGVELLRTNHEPRITNHELDRTREPFKPALKPSTDVRELSAEVSGQRLLVRLRLRGNPNPKLTYQLHLFAPAVNGGKRRHIVVRQSNSQTVRMSDCKTTRLPDCKTTFTRRTVIFSLPHFIIAQRHACPITIDAVVYDKGKIVDRSPLLILYPRLTADTLTAKMVDGESVFINKEAK